MYADSIGSDASTKIDNLTHLATTSPPQPDLTRKRNLAAIVRGKPSPKTQQALENAVLGPQPRLADTGIARKLLDQLAQQKENPK